MLGDSPSARIGRMVADRLVTQSVVDGDDAEISMSDDVLKATLDLRAFLFDAVYENDAATAEFKKAWGILEGLWSKVREEPTEFLDRRTLERDDVDVAARGFSRRHDGPVRHQSLRRAFPCRARGDAPSDSGSQPTGAILTGSVTSLISHQTRGDMSLLLNLRELRESEDRIDRTLGIGELSTGSGDDYAVAAPIALRLRVLKDGDKYRLVGRVATRLLLGCCRCLDPFDMSVDLPIDLMYLPQRDNVGDGDLEDRRRRSVDRVLPR